MLPPMNPELYVLEITTNEHERTRRVLIKIEEKTGHQSSISVKVYSREDSNWEAWAFIGSFGGRLEYHDQEVPIYHITSGDMYLRIMRGLGIGTWCQNQVLLWLKQQPPGRTKSFSLAEIDSSDSDRERRNRFYEQFGIKFNWTTDRFRGESVEQHTSELNPVINIKNINSVRIDISLAKAYDAISHLEQELGIKRSQLIEIDSKKNNKIKVAYRINYTLIVIIFIMTLYIIK